MVLWDGRIWFSSLATLCCATIQCQPGEQVPSTQGTHLCHRVSVHMSWSPPRTCSRSSLVRSTHERHFVRPRPSQPSEVALVCQAVDVEGRRRSRHSIPLSHSCLMPCSPVHVARQNSQTNGKVCVSGMQEKSSSTERPSNGGKDRFSNVNVGHRAMGTTTLPTGLTIG